MNNPWTLKNKIAFISGGTKGIGKACVLEFLKLGATVIFSARNSEEVLAFEEQLQNENYDAYGLTGDVSDADHITAIVSFIEQKFGKLNILVNNAGINIRKNTQDYSKEEYEKILNINLIAPYELSKQLFELLKKGGKASIINIASVAGSLDVKSGSPYAMSKGGILQQTRSLAVEWASYNIRVNAVSPWYTKTPLAAPVFKQEERIGHIIERTPMKRVAEASEMATVVAFLAMESASYITGQNIVADGGISVSAL